MAITLENKRTDADYGCAHCGTPIKEGARALHWYNPELDKKVGLVFCDFDCAREYHLVEAARRARKALVFDVNWCD